MLGARVPNRPPEGATQASNARGPPGGPPTQRPPGGPVSTSASSDDRPQPKLLIPHQGRLLKLKGVDNSPDRRGGGKRGQVNGFSRQSRMRLMELCASMSRQARPDHWLFLTLTYPGVFPSDPTVYHRDLATLFKRFRRDYPRCSALWKLEYQERGAPHFHILAYGECRVPNQWLSLAWYNIVASGDSRHLAAGTRVERPRTWNGVTWYASKYIGKVVPGTTQQHTGRIWGIHNRVALPLQIVEYNVTWATFHALRRIMRRYNNGAKPHPAIPNSGTKRTTYHMRNTKVTQGCKLFVDAALAERMYTAASIAAQTVD